jgi:uncharacterized membrane protein YGL010W
MTRKIDALLAEYGESHQNPTNKLVHWICVPAIFWSIAALIWSFPVPGFFPNIANFNWLTILLGLTVLYYLIMSWQLAIGIVLFVMVCLWLIVWYQVNFSLPLWQFALGIFVVAWIGQFWGHKVEGKKPSFFKDVQFLLIGPAWLLHFLYKKAGIPY